MLVPVGHEAAAVVVRGLRKSLRRAYGRRRRRPRGVHRRGRSRCSGPNGAGKTTTVEILEGYRRRDAGEVSVLGQDPADATPAWRARVGIVLQSVTDLSELTVRETVRHFAGYYPDPRDPEEVIATVGLADSAGQRTRLLSGGQRRRLDVALGILGRPELLFLDEPTTGFDPAARRHFWALVEDLAGRGHHDPAHHALPRGGRAAGRPGRGHRARAHPRGRHAGDARADASTPLATVAWTEPGRRHAGRCAPPSPPGRSPSSPRRFGGEVPDLSVTRPTLEETYLAMVGGAVTTPATVTIGSPALASACAGCGSSCSQFTRDREAAFFTLILPVLLLLVFGSAFNDESHPASPSASTSWPG